MIVGEEVKCELMLDWVHSAHPVESRTLNFTYEQKNSPRLWHPLQNITRPNKPVLWKSMGLPWNYDIRTCAPQVIYQLAVRSGLRVETPYLRAYLKDKSDLRLKVAKLVDMDPDAAKSLINSLFCGARLGCNPHYALFRLLERDEVKMSLLQTDLEVKGLRQDISACWKVIKKTLYPLQTKRLTPKQKWGLYFSQERQLLEVVRTICAETGVKMFCEHDGWRANQQMNVEALKQRILEETEFEVDIEETVY